MHAELITEVNEPRDRCQPRRARAAQERKRGEDHDRDRDQNRVVNEYEEKFWHVMDRSDRSGIVSANGRLWQLTCAEKGNRPFRTESESRRLASMPPSPVDHRFEAAQHHVDGTGAGNRTSLQRVADEAEVVLCDTREEGDFAVRFIYSMAMGVIEAPSF